MNRNRCSYVARVRKNKNLNAPSRCEVRDTRLDMGEEKGRNGESRSGKRETKGDKVRRNLEKASSKI